MRRKIRIIALSNDFREAKKMTVISEVDGKIRITPTEEYIDDEEFLIGETVNRFLQKGSNRIVFDLSNVKFIGDSGMSLLLRVHNATYAQGGGVGIRGLRTELLKVFQLTRLDKIFEIIPNPAK